MLDGEQTLFFRLSPMGPASKRLAEAEHYYLQGNLNEALAAAQQAWREHPAEADVMRVLAYVHMSRGEYPPAAQAAWQAITRDGENPASYATMGQVYLTFNMLAQADETLSAAIKKFPNDVSLLVLAADLSFRRGNSDRGAELASRVLANNPDDGYAGALLGVYYKMKKRYPEAARLLTRAVQVYPRRWDYLRDLGISRLHTEEYAGALEALSLSFRRYPFDLDAKRHLFLALKLAADSSSFYWRTAFFFFVNSAFGWLINIIGVVCSTVGLIWGLIALGDTDVSIMTPSLVFLFGLFLMILPHAGLIAGMRRGERFDRYLSRELTKLNIPPVE